MVTIKLENEDALEMLMNRVNVWEKNPDIKKLYEKMYENYIDLGCFDNMVLDVLAIVDNDCVNYCKVLEKGDEEFSKLLKIYNKQGLGDCSCECDFTHFIEAVDNEKKT